MDRAAHHSTVLSLRNSDTDSWIGYIDNWSQDSDGEAKSQISNTLYKIPSGFGTHDANTDTYSSTSYTLYYSITRTLEATL